MFWIIFSKDMKYLKFHLKTPFRKYLKTPFISVD